MSLKNYLGHFLSPKIKVLYLLSMIFFSKQHVKRGPIGHLRGLEFFWKGTWTLDQIWHHCLIRMVSTGQSMNHRKCHGIFLESTLQDTPHSGSKWPFQGHRGIFSQFGEFEVLLELSRQGDEESWVSHTLTHSFTHCTCNLHTFWVILVNFGPNLTCLVSKSMYSSWGIQ